MSNDHWLWLSCRRFLPSGTTATTTTKTTANSPNSVASCSSRCEFTGSELVNWGNVLVVVTAQNRSSFLPTRGGMVRPCPNRASILQCYTLFWAEALYCRAWQDSATAFQQRCVKPLLTGITQWVRCLLRSRIQRSTTGGPRHTEVRPCKIWPE